MCDDCPVVARICWSCEAFAQMEPVSGSIDLRGRPGATTTAFSCLNCGQISISIFVNPSGSLPETLWVPSSPIGKEFTHVPEHIAGAADESHRCHSYGAYRAAVLLARSVVEATAKDKGVSQGSLVDKIDTMEARGLIRAIVKDAAHEIRFLGNEMAHGDFVEPVTEEESNEILELMGMVLNEVYQEPAKIEARRKARLAKKATPSASGQQG